MILLIIAKNKFEGILGIMSDEFLLASPEMERISREIIPLLLQGADPRLELLRQQWEGSSISISRASSVGFYADIAVPSSSPKLGNLNRGSGGVEISIKNCALPAWGILYVIDGILKFLEVYNVESWQEHPVFGQLSNIEPFSFE